MVYEKELDAAAVEELQVWLKTQRHLPQITELLMRRYYLACKSNMEATKKLIEYSYVVRNNYPHVFFDRDPLSPEIQKAFEVTDMLPLPNLTKEKSRILLYRLVDVDPKNYIFNDVIKTFFIVSDTRLGGPDLPDNGFALSEIPIFDMAGFTLRHATKAVISTLRAYMKYTQECAPVTLKQIHIINCPSFLDKVLMIVKPFLKSEVFKMIHFHLPNSETLYPHVDKELLPNELGGKAGSIAEIKQDWLRRIKNNRDHLMDDKYWRIKENLRNKNNPNQVTEGFKSLCID